MERTSLHYRLHHDPKSSHQQIVAYLRRRGRSPILDVGSAQGMLGHQLQGTNLVLDAVEPHPDWANLARPWYRQVWNCSIEEAPLPAATYHTVVCADVLEHLPDPVRVIQRLRDAAIPGATFLLSLPNVAHLAVRLMLLGGAFPRMERGILDRTHLQFYTRSTLCQMLREAGLEIRGLRSTGVPLEELMPSWRGRLPYRLAARLQHGALSLWPRLFAFQWVVVASSPGPAAVAASDESVSPAATAQASVPSTK